MKNIQKTLLIMTVPFLLSGCVKSLNHDQFAEKFATVEANLVNDATFPTSLHVNSKNNTSAYDYKEGEYYRHTTWALLILVPVTSNDSTWKDGDKYYHYHKDAISSSDPTYKEITKEQFDTYMAAGLATMKSLFANPINKAKELMGYDEETSEEDPTAIREYSSVVNKYSAKGNDLTLRSDATPNIEGSEVVHYNITFKNGYPSCMKTKIGDDGSEDKMDYKVNYSQFTAPSDPSTQTSEE